MNYSSRTAIRFTLNVFRSRPDRLRSIADRFNLDHEAMLDNVLYARAYTSEHQYEMLDFVAAKFHEEPGVFKLLVRRRSNSHFLRITLQPYPNLDHSRSSIPSWRCSAWTSAAAANSPTDNRNWLRCFPDSKKCPKVRPTGIKIFIFKNFAQMKSLLTQSTTWPCSSPIR